jgi:predicted ester cyclase
MSPFLSHLQSPCYETNEAIMKTGLQVGLLLLLAFSVLAQDKPSAHKSGIAESWISAWNSHDVPFASVNHGSAELRKFATSEFDGSPDLHVELGSSSIQGNHGIIEWTFSGTDKGIFKTGKKFSVRGVSILTLKNGKISRNVDYYDAATVMKQLGLLPDTATTN